MSTDKTYDELFNSSSSKEKSPQTIYSPPDWENISWRQLKKGEQVKRGDWVDLCRDGWRDDPKWVLVTKTGDIAPDPLYPSHRTFRRII